VPSKDKLVELPDDSDELKAMLRSLLLKHDAEKRRAEDLHIENLRLRVELDRYKKWYYGPRADRLRSESDLAQMLLGFAETLDQKPVNPEDVPPHTEPDEELRRVKRERYVKGILWSSVLRMILMSWDITRKKKCCDGGALYRSKRSAARV